MKYVKLKPGHQENAPFFLREQAMSLDDIYLLVGEIENAPGHAYLLSTKHGRVAIVYTMVHLDRLEDAEL